MIWLNVGAGPFPAPAPWINADVVRCPEHGINPDIIASITDLPYGDGEVDLLYAGHCLEHLTLRGGGLDAALMEVRRVLAPDGVACFVCPDVYRALDGYRDGWVDRATMLGCLEGPDSGVTSDGAWEGHYHEWNCSSERLLGLVQATFPDAAALDMDSPLLDRFPLVSRVRWQCATISRS